MSFTQWRGTDSYLSSAALDAAVNCAIALERPLLVRGEPGTGKTQLAEALAHGLGLPLIFWPVKSTTCAQDGLYVYDTVQRLYDSRFGDGDVQLDERLLEQALAAFYALRDLQGLRKRPSTSELIDWVAVLKRAGIGSVQLEEGMPFLGALLKREQDLLAFAEAMHRGRRPRA